MQYYNVTIQRSNGKHFYWHGAAMGKVFAECFALETMAKYTDKTGCKVLTVEISKNSTTNQQTFSFEV